MKKKNLFSFLLFLLLVNTTIVYAAEEQSPVNFVNARAKTVAELQNAYADVYADGQGYSLIFDRLYRYVDDEHECGPWRTFNWSVSNVYERNDNIFVLWTNYEGSMLTAFAIGRYDSENDIFLDVEHHSLASDWVGEG